MSEREAFGHHEPDEDIQVVAARGENGEVFDHFELILPRGSTVARGAGSLVIQTARYRLKVTPRFDGFSANLPSDFEELYFGVPFNTYSPKKVGLDITIDFKWWSLLVPSGWDHYEWLDSFVERLEKSFCFDTFLRHVGWEVAHTVAVVTRSATKARADAA